MKKLFDKSELLFALLSIAVYVAGCSAADLFSERIGIESCVTLPFLLVLCTVLYLFVRRNGLQNYFGLCAPGYPAGKFLFFLPAALLASVNLWCGTEFSLPLPAAFCTAGSMLLVGFAEELIFRGFLFRAMYRETPRAAAAVSSITFGLGHIVNLLNGSGEHLVSGLCQVVYAIAIGFLFVTIFLRGGSILPCILVHSVFNALSVIGKDTIQDGTLIVISLLISLLSVGYALFLIRTLPVKKMEGARND